MLLSSVLAWIQTYCPLLHGPEMPYYSSDAFSYKHETFIFFYTSGNKSFFDSPLQQSGGLLGQGK